MPTTTTPETVVEGLLRELVAEVRGLRSDLTRRPVPSLSREDRARLSRLLPAIGATLGSELFNSAELHEHGSPALRLVRAGLNAKQLGRLLRRAANTPIDGYMVLHEGTEAGAALWRVVQVPDFPGHQKPFRSSRAAARAPMMAGKDTP
jgi:hypothetical protein